MSIKCQPLVHDTVGEGTMRRNDVLLRIKTSLSWKWFRQIEKWQVPGFLLSELTDKLLTNQRKNENLTVNQISTHNRSPHLTRRSLQTLIADWSETYWALQDHSDKTKDGSWTFSDWPKTCRYPLNQKKSIRWICGVSRELFHRRWTGVISEAEVVPWHFLYVCHVGFATASHIKETSGAELLQQSFYWVCSFLRGK